MSFAFLTLWTIALFLGFAGAFNLLAPESWRESVASWNYPPDLKRAGGMIEIAAALLLVFPATRLAGLALAGFALFAADVLLVEKNRYAAAAVGMLLMAALVPASLS